MEQPAVATSSKKSGKDLLIGACGFVTSLLTAVILWWVEQDSGFAFYTWTIWFIIPVGALLAGFAGASGYYAGSWFFGHRPTRLLLVNVVIASVATFFLIHYLSYVTLQVEGQQVSDYIPFTQYLDVAIRSTSMGFRFRTAKLGSTGELGGLGYAVALLQIGGFAIGGLAVYGYLLLQPYCDRCSCYLSAKGKQVRYTGDAEGLQGNTTEVLRHVENGAITAAVERQKHFGTSGWQKGNHLRSVCAVRHCKGCGQHWVRFAVETRSGRNWKEIDDLTVTGFTDEVVSV